jgi:hypothetical protein
MRIGIEMDWMGIMIGMEMGMRMMMGRDGDEDVAGMMRRRMGIAGFELVEKFGSQYFPSPVKTSNFHLVYYTSWDVDLFDD